MKVVLLCGVILILIMSFAPGTLWERMSTIGDKEQDYNMTASSGRIAVWKRGIGFMLANPVLGVGPDVFAVADGESHGGRGKWSVAHNSFVQVGAELGVTGLVLFVMMIVKSLQSLSTAHRKLPTGSPEAGLVGAIQIGFYGYLSTGFFLSQAYSSLLILLTGLSVMITKLVMEDSS
jgi:O-antigen ligase